MNVHKTKTQAIPERFHSVTPYLAIRYQPTEWPFATDPVPKPIKR